MSETTDQPAVVGSGLRAHREIDETHVAPGTTVEATIVIEDADGRFVLGEAASGPELAVVETEPEPVDIIQRDTELRVAWDTTGDARLDYEIHVPEDAADGTTFTLSGAVRTDTADRDVRGDQTLTVVADLFERIVSTSVVSDADLQLARERYEADTLSAAQFDRIHRAWLRDGARPQPAADESPPELVDDATDESTPDGHSDEESADRQTERGGDVGAE